jgi:hypothetical protein
MPFVAASRLTPAQLIGISLTELQGPLADRFVGYEDAATSHSFFDVAKAERKAEIEPYDVADDLGREADADVKLGVCHSASLQKLIRRAKLTVPFRRRHDFLSGVKRLL